MSDEDTATDIVLLIRDPLPTTLDRMHRTAAAEAGRIEIIQRLLIEQGACDAPSEQQLLLRDDYEGIVRLIDRIKADTIILERIRK